MTNKWEISENAKYEHMWYVMRNETWNEWEKYVFIVLWYEMASIKQMWNTWVKEMLCEWKWIWKKNMSV